MTIQLDTTLRNNMVGQYETTIGTAPKLYFRTGAQPSTCATADSGSLLATLTLPSDWMTAASSGSVTLNGTWTGTASATGTVAHYRIKDSSGTTCYEQGTVTATGGGGDMTVDNTSIASGQTINVTTWTRTQSGA